MRTVGAYELKTHLSELLDCVEQGESITITRHGVPVAVLGPTVDHKNARAVEAIERWKEVGKNITLGEGLTIRQLIDEGRKY